MVVLPVCIEPVSIPIPVNRVFNREFRLFWPVKLGKTQCSCRFRRFLHFSEQGKNREFHLEV